MDGPEVDDAAYDDFGNYIGPVALGSDAGFEAYAAVGAEVIVSQEETQSLETPLVAPPRPPRHPLPWIEGAHVESARRRPVVAFVGPLHSGKSTLVRALAGVRCDGSTPEELDRGVTLFWRAVSSTRAADGSRVLALDAPGHPDFGAEMASAIAGADALALVLDAAVEGAASRDAGRVAAAVRRAGLPYVLILNKLDRLPLELRVPPAFAAARLLTTLAEVAAAMSAPPRAIVLASGEQGWAFRFRDVAPATISWRHGAQLARYVLEPLYKIVARVLVAAEDDPRLHFAAAIGAWTGRCGVAGALEAVSEIAVAAAMVACPGTSEPLCIPLAFSMQPTPEDGDAAAPWLLCRHRAGTLVAGETVLACVARGAGGAPASVLAVGPLDELAIVTEGAQFASVRGALTEPGHLVAVRGGFARIPLGFGGGTVVLLGGDVIRGGSITGDVPGNVPSDPVGIPSTLRVALEPRLPSELPRLIEALRRAAQLYLALGTTVEESGERAILGPGELYLDSALRAIRGGGRGTPPLDLQMAVPTAVFAETVIDRTPRLMVVQGGGALRLSILAEPLEPDVQVAIASGRATPDDLVAAGWDRQTAERDLLAFAPRAPVAGHRHVNALIDERRRPLDDRCAETTGDAAAFADALRRGFDWACREGPLCDEPLRGVKLRLVATEGGDGSATLAQVIPAIRRAVHQAVLAATPRLLEPIYAAQITAPVADRDAVVQVVSKLLATRRGRFHGHRDLQGTPLFVADASLPALDSLGFETELRARTRGQAFALLQFEGWGLVPGDPRDPDVEVPVLAVAPANSLARDVLVKIRRRKGLAGVAM